MENDISKQLEHEVAERKRLEVALKEAQERAADLIKYAPTGIYEIDFKTKRFLSVNDAMCSLSGYSREELMAMGSAAILTDESKALFAERIQKTLLGEPVDRDVDYQVIHKDGHIMQVVLHTRFIRDDSGAVTGAFVIGHDVTKSRRTEHALHERQGDLEMQVAERTRELMRSEQQLRHLSNQLLIAQEIERKRIAGEIHDSVGQSLAAIKMRVQNVLYRIEEGLPRTKETSLEAVIPIIQQSMDEVRRIQTALRPPMLDELGLVPTIDWFLREFKTTYPSIKVTKNIMVDESDLMDLTKTAIFRIIQEAFNNIGKHSGATQAQLALQEAKDHLVLQIRDNGTGFDLIKTEKESSVNESMGLGSMRERAQYAGGTITIDSSSGKGTKINIIWPLADSLPRTESH